MIREVAKDWVHLWRSADKFEAGTPAIVESIGWGLDRLRHSIAERIARTRHDL